MPLPAAGDEEAAGEALWAWSCGLFTEEGLRGSDGGSGKRVWKSSTDSSRVRGVSPGAMPSFSARRKREDRLVADECNWQRERMVRKVERQESKRRGENRLLIVCGGGLAAMWCRSLDVFPRPRTGRLLGRLVSLRVSEFIWPGAVQREVEKRLRH